MEEYFGSGLTSQNRQDGGWTPPATAGRVASDLVPSGKGHPDAADGGATEPTLIRCNSGVGSVVTGLGRLVGFPPWNFFWKCRVKSCKTPKSGVKPHFLNDRFANICDLGGVSHLFAGTHTVVGIRSGITVKCGSYWGFERRRIHVEIKALNVGFLNDHGIMNMFYLVFWCFLVLVCWI
jgi:hypothetical protein